VSRSSGLGFGGLKLCGRIIFSIAQMREMGTCQTIFIVGTPHSTEILVPIFYEVSHKVTIPALHDFVIRWSNHFY
jgi:hypothetical protein